MYSKKWHEILWNFIYICAFWRTWKIGKISCSSIFNPIVMFDCNYIWVINGFLLVLNWYLWFKQVYQQVVRIIVKKSLLFCLFVQLARKKRIYTWSVSLLEKKVIPVIPLKYHVNTHDFACQVFLGITLFFLCDTAQSQ